jgi:uncharacterized membrane protein YfcA
MREFMWRLVHLEPALWRALVMAVVALAGSVGILISPDLPESLLGVLGAVLAIVQMMWTRGAVTPNAKVVVSAPDPIGDPATVTAGEATTEASTKDILDAAREVPRG